MSTDFRLEVYQNEFLPEGAREVNAIVTVTSTGGALNRYPAGAQVTLQRISGHRDADATACPGDGLYAQLPRLRQMVAAITLPPAPKLALEAASTQITFGSKVALQAHLSAPDGTPLGARPLELQVFGKAGWNTLQSLRTDATGGLSTKLRLAYNHSVRARFTGDPAFGDALAKPLPVGVRPLVQAQLDPSTSARVTRGALVKVTGTVRPHKATALLLVDRITSTGRKVRTVRRLLSVRAGRVQARLRFTHTGSYSAQVGSTSAFSASLRRLSRALAGRAAAALAPRQARSGTPRCEHPEARRGRGRCCAAACTSRPRAAHGRAR